MQHFLELPIVFVLRNIVIMPPPPPPNYDICKHFVSNYMADVLVDIIDLKSAISLSLILLKRAKALIQLISLNLLFF